MSKHWFSRRPKHSRQADILVVQADELQAKVSAAGVGVAHTDNENISRERRTDSRPDIIPQERSSLLSLPRELRDLILEHALRSGEYEWGYDANRNPYREEVVRVDKSWRVPPLLHTCRLLRIEGAEIYYPMHTFFAFYAAFGPGFDHFLTLPATHKMLVERLRVVSDIGGEETDDVETMEKTLGFRKGSMAWAWWEEAAWTPKAWRGRELGGWGDIRVWVRSTDLPLEQREDKYNGQWPLAPRHKKELGLA
jgi:hypothetical protein